MALACLPRPTSRRRLAARPCGRVQQQGFVRPSLVFAACKNGGRGGRNGRIRCEKFGRGPGVRALFRLGVNGWNGEQFGLNLGKICEGEGGFHRFLRLCPESRRRSAVTAVLAGVDGGAGFAVGLAAAFGFPLVPVLFALGKGQFALDASVAEVKPGGDERVSLDLRL